MKMIVRLVACKLNVKQLYSRVLNYKTDFNSFWINSYKILNILTLLLLHIHCINLIKTYLYSRLSEPPKSKINYDDTVYGSTVSLTKEASFR